VLLLSGPGAGTPKSDADTPTVDERAIYSTLIGCPESSAIVRESTTVFVDEDVLDGPLSISWQRATARDWALRSRAASTLRPLGQDCPAIRFVANSELTRWFGTLDEEVSSEHGWDDFERRYPGPARFLAFSRIGFSTDHREAMVYEAENCRGWCGQASRVVLRKDGDVWAIQRSFLRWAR